MKKHLDVISNACITFGAMPSFRLKPGAKAAIICAMALQTAFVQAADFANATVVGGSISGSTVGTLTTVTQTTQRGALDWTQLSTAATETLRFDLPNASAMIFNRITGTSPSQFLGPLNSNGQVFIQNPNGILFGAGSQVNVGGLVASTLSMTPSDFMNGNFVFTKDANSAGNIRNLGTLTAAQGGYIALLSPSVINEGIVSANLGNALLAAGNKVTLSLNNGSLLGYSIDQGAVNALIENKQLVRANGGEVIMSAKALDSLTASVVNHSGVIEATTMSNVAGKILLKADTVTVSSSSTLTADQINIDSVPSGTGPIPVSVGPLPLRPIDWIVISPQPSGNVTFVQPTQPTGALQLVRSSVYQGVLTSVGKINTIQTGSFGTVQTGNAAPLNLTSSPTIGNVNSMFVIRTSVLDVPEN